MNRPMDPMPRGIVKLNVGGFRFTTSRSTLCRYPGTLLEMMFSGRHDFPAEVDEEDGSYFIDRDGRHFHHVLNFLRVGHVVSLPDANAARDELAAEADFYGLEELSRAIQQPQVDILSHLPPAVLKIREEEDKLRRAYSKRQATLFGGNHGLVSLFECPGNQVVDSNYIPPIKYDEQVIQDTDLLCMTLRDNTSRMSNGEVFATCETITQFKFSFNDHHPNILRRLKYVLRNKNIIIAGGSVLQALSSGENSRTQGWWGGESDVDLFIYGVDVFRANTIARQVYDALAVNGEEWGICRSGGVINFHQQVDGCIVQKVQIVLRIYDSPAEVLFGFDVDCCCCAFDGKDVWLTKRCLLALRTGTNIVNPIHATPSTASYELRLAKYAKRGYSVLIPGLDKSRVDFTRILPADLSSLKGLARLLKVSQELESQANLEIPSIFQRDHMETPTEEMHLVPALAKEIVNCRDGAELLTSGHGWYHELGVDVIIPFIMRSRRFPSGLMWYDYCCDFPVSDEDTRDDAWNDIMDFEDAPGSLPRYLSQAWDTSKRSREYLNAEIDSFDLNSIYYSEAYRK